MAFSLFIGRAMKLENLQHITSSSGNEKKILDSIRSLLNLLNKWDEQHLAGKHALAPIMKLKDSIGYNLDNLPAGAKLDALLEACNNLGAVVEEMACIAQELQTLAQQIRVLSNLEQYQSQKSSRLPVFQCGTWDCTKFGKVFQNISDAFSVEINALTTIKECAVISANKPSLTAYIARWNNPGCYNNQVRMLINGLLIESSLCKV